MYHTADNSLNSNKNKNDHKTKVLAYKINPGALCNLITAYGEPDLGQLTGNGQVETQIVIDTTQFVATDPLGGNDTMRLERDRERTAKITKINQLVMFLKPWTGTESLVLAGKEYWIVQDKNLEPVMNINNLPFSLKEWIEQYNQALSVMSGLTAK